MATIAGSVAVGGFIAPTDTSDTYAVTDDIYGRGGYRPVADNTARDAITSDRRKIGMLVRVTSDGKFWTLSSGILNTDWAEISFSATGAVRYDTTQTLNTGEKLQASTNIGVGNTEIDLLATYTAAKL